MDYDLIENLSDEQINELYQDDINVAPDEKLSRIDSFYCYMSRYFYLVAYIGDIRHAYYVWNQPQATEEYYKFQYGELVFGTSYQNIDCTHLVYCQDMLYKTIKYVEGVELSRAGYGVNFHGVYNLLGTFNPIKAHFKYYNPSVPMSYYERYSNNDPLLLYTGQSWQNIPGKLGQWAVHHSYLQLHYHYFLNQNGTYHQYAYFIVDPYINVNYHSIDNTLRGDISGNMFQLKYVIFPDLYHNVDLKITQLGYAVCRR